MNREHLQAGNTHFQDTHREDRQLVDEFLSQGVDDIRGRNAFDRLVIKYRDRVFTICYRMLGEYEEANDCAQDVFIKVYRNLSGFRFQSGFSTWLFRIAVNTCKNHIASRAQRDRRKTLSLNGTDNPGSGSRRIDHGSHRDGPDRLYEKNETWKTIHEAIQTLPVQQRTLVVLRDIEGRPYEEIASVTGLALGTVKSKLNRAREQLKTRLKDILADEL